jgi:hypothetical protein
MKGQKVSKGIGITGIVKKKDTPGIYQRIMSREAGTMELGRHAGGLIPTTLTIQMNTKEITTLNNIHKIVILINTNIITINKITITNTTIHTLLTIHKINTIITKTKLIAIEKVDTHNINKITITNMIIINMIIET